MLSDWFAQVATPLERIQVPRTIHVTIAMDAITRGQDWDAVRNAFEAWLRTDAQRLADGQHRLVIPGVPFPVDVWRYAPTTVGPRVFFGRYTPKDDSLAERIRAQVARKREKLAPYKDAGKTTVLLLENDDLAQMNHIKMTQTVRSALPDGRPDRIDQLWYVSTAYQPSLEF